MKNVTCSCNVVKDHLSSVTKDLPSLAINTFYLNDKQNKHYVEQQVYKVQRETDTVCDLDVYVVEPSQLTIPAGQSSNFKLQYWPKVPSTVDFDYFSIHDTNGLYLQFGTRGKSIGPQVSVAIKTIKFLCSIKKKTVHRIIELRNESDIAAHFQFDIDKKQTVFKIDKTIGVIEAHKYQYIRINFMPTSPGTYIKQIYCLVHYQPPVVIEAVGVCTTIKEVYPKGFNTVRYPNLQVLDDGYKSYISDKCHIARHNPPLTLSVTELDLGRGSIAEERSVPQMFRVNSHIKKSVLLKWDIDVAGVFRVSPQCATIPPYQSTVFEAYFEPPSPDLLYGVELEGRAYWVHIENTRQQRTQLPVPIPLSLRMMGHSFPARSYGWMPQYQVSPQTVVLPPCIPPEPVYTTFLIKRFGHLPITFRLFPPNMTEEHSSHFTLLSLDREEHSSHFTLLSLDREEHSSHFTLLSLDREEHSSHFTLLSLDREEHSSHFTLLSLDREEHSSHFTLLSLDREEHSSHFTLLSLDREEHSSHFTLLSLDREEHSSHFTLLSLDREEHSSHFTLLSLDREEHSSHFTLLSLDREEHSSHFTLLSLDREEHSSHFTLLSLDREEHSSHFTLLSLDREEHSSHFTLLSLDREEHSSHFTLLSLDREEHSSHFTLLSLDREEHSSHFTLLSLDREEHSSHFTLLSLDREKHSSHFTLLLYTVKPLQGLIEGEYQIVVVQMYPSPPCEGAHTEKWLLQFNGSSEHEVRYYVGQTMVDFQETKETVPRFQWRREGGVLAMWCLTVVRMRTKEGVGRKVGLPGKESTVALAVPDLV
uniref:CFAP65 fourth Ig-like domain-containing protein n=1 Tax=Timema poppense TaxID=170557 RepID=A0A7R9DDG2_TIMPO|nr:unnamed protein product [Timema poppensis]